MSFRPAGRIPLKISEDEYFNIYSMCRGEWGGTIFFTDKSTGESFVAASSCTLIVNRSANNYYVTEIDGTSLSCMVVRIDDPHKLEKSVPDFDAREGSEFKKGVEVLLPRTDIFIFTSFFMDNQLVHLYTDQTNTYLGRVVNGRMVPFYTFNFLFYADLQQQLKDGTQVLTFKKANFDSLGILIIKGNDLTFYHHKLSPF